jgi:1,2-diacylglycerol 3-beta-galactosyltransferase
MKKPHVLFLFSDTGGGHRSAAEAIIEALGLEFGEAITTEMVDFLKDHAPLPFNMLPDFYPQIVKAPRIWGASFHATDGHNRTRLISASVWPYVRHTIKAMIKKHPADLIVTVHFLATTLTLNALGKERPPFFTVVTDIASTHAIWFDNRSDLIFVPTETARQRALTYGVYPEKLKVVGLPVADRFCRPIKNKRALRKKLNWPLNKPIVLLVGGGEGMGPIAKIARAIEESGLDLGLIIVAGRNEPLRKNLESKKWENFTLVYGFTRDMPDFMQAADILVTKSGPATLIEGLNANIPIVMYGKLPGQEDGNVTFIEGAGAGVYAPTPLLVVRTITRWISRPDERKQIIANTRIASRPDSARTIARTIGERLGLVRNNINDEGKATP